MTGSSSIPSCVHICPEDVKFIAPFIAFVKEHFDIKAHRFLFLSKEGREFIEDEECAVNIRKPADILKHIWLLYSADKIILHALMSRKLVLFLALQPWLLKKCYWIIWGRDLYARQKNLDNGLKGRLDEWLRGFVIRRMGHIVTFIKGDYDLACAWYGTRARYHRSFVYQSNVYQDDILEEVQGEDGLISPHQGLHILLGNSAHPENNHKAVLERLAYYKGKEILVYAPLTYGDADYRQAVIEQGAACLGEQFIALSDFMPFRDYARFLAGLDIAIFAHDRQQAMGNIITLTGMGKTIYLKDNHTLWASFTDLGIKFFNLDSLDLKLLEEADVIKNRALIKEYFSQTALLNSLDWMK